MYLLLVPTFAQCSNAKVLIDNDLSRRFDDFDLHVKLWEVSKPTDGCVV